MRHLKAWSTRLPIPGLVAALDQGRDKTLIGLVRPTDWTARRVKKDRIACTSTAITDDGPTDSKAAPR